jgi:hypothetical protein
VWYKYHKLIFNERRKNNMAKLTGPLMSIDARGKLANAMVFIGWKGLKTVRQWVKPANPNTAGQQTIRSYFTSAVAKYHLLTGADKAAWDPRTAGQPLSGFNLFVKKVINILKVAAGAWVLISNVSAVAATRVVTVTSDTSILIGDAIVKWGLTSGSYPNEQANTGAITAGTPYTFPALAAGTPGQTYFYIVTAEGAVPTTAGESGEYSFVLP